MFKKAGVILFILFVCSAVVFAQTDEEVSKEKPKLGFNMNFNIGLSSYEDIDGNQVAFQKFSFFPEFTYGKWGLGLDITFEFDGDWELRDLDKDGKADRWSDPKDYLQKIFYIRYGYKGDPLYGRIGAFQSYTLGHGLIMEGYNNTIFYPQVIQLGLNLDVDGSVFNFPYIGMESVVDDVLDWDIMGIRVYTRPLMNLSTPIINKLEVGATIVTDQDTQEEPTTDPPKDNEDKESVTEFGFDVEVPLLERQDMNLIAYADWATISGKGSGSWIGSTYTYRWLKLLAQLRFFGKQFVPNYFDSHYENERDGKYNKLNEYDQFYMGYLIGTELGILNILNFYFHWSDGFNDPEEPRVQTGIGTAEDAIPKIEAAFMYDKKDIDNFKDFFEKEDSLLQLEIGYKVTKGTAIVLIYQITYSPYTNEETSRMFVETRFTF